MIIQQSNVGMASQHQAMQRLQQSEQLQSWFGPRPQQAEGNRGGERVSLSPRGQAIAQQAHAANEARQAQRVRSKDENEDEQLDPKLLLIKQAIESLTGQEIKLVNLQDFALDAQRSVSASESASQQIQAGYGMEYSYQASYTETESLDFSASGTVKTADGRELQFNLEISMERSFSFQTSQQIQIGNALQQKKDPLVLNVNAPAAQLTDQKFDFDVDSDGKADPGDTVRYTATLTNTAANLANLNVGDSILISNSTTAATVPSIGCSTATGRLRGRVCASRKRVSRW